MHITTVCIIICDRILENGSKSHIFIYYYNMNGITFSTLFHIITWNLMLKLSKLYSKYSGNKYVQVEIQLNTC